MEAPVSHGFCRACGTTLSAGGTGVGQLCYGCLLETALARAAGNEPPRLDGPAPAGSADNEPGSESFAHYKLTTGADGLPVELGRGAMAVTYRATDTVLRCPVALKVINVDLAAHPDTRTRFLREAQAAAGLRHPHVASVFFFGERFADGHPFYAMELVEGETLQDRVRRAGGLPPAVTLEIAAQVAGALTAAEARRITHRDLKPANLMLAAGEGVNVKVIDFGLAKAAVDPANADPSLTQAEAFVGTPAFASPEQFDHWESVDARSDFYALGATLWYALTGETPFSSGTLAQIHERQLHHPLPVAQLRVAHVPRPLEELLCSLLSADAAGRPQTAAELEDALNRCRERLAARPRAGLRRTLSRIAATCGVVAFLLAATWLARGRWRTRPLPPAPTAAPALAKSVAVLPFDNLSADKGNTFFADGVQDEILTDLSHVADLKVISRTSVLGYRDPGKRPPAPEIGQELGVSYLLEGSVQREGQRIRVSAQLIDAAHDRHVWAETFDRDLSDVFAIQSEVASTIAAKLQAQVSAPEKAALDEAPTRDLAAYELYLHAKDLIYNFDPNVTKHEPLYESVRLLEEATARDPDFYAAWCLLTDVYGILLRLDADPTPTARAAQAQKALATVRRLRPGAGDTHLTAATYFYNIHDLTRGRPELALARQMLPNNWRVFFVTGTTDMIAGRWGEALAAMEKARALNPLHLNTLTTLSIIYEDLRRYDNAKRVVESAIADGISPDFFAMRHAAIVQAQTGDNAEYHAVFKRLAGQGPPSERTTIIRWVIAMRDHDYDEAARIVAADPRQDFGARISSTYPRAFLLGRIALARGDLKTALADFATVRPVYEEALRRRPDDADAWTQLTDLDIRMGRKEDAVREALRAATLLPISQDAQEGPKVAANLASAYGVAGEMNKALDLLESLQNVPAALNYGYLATDEDWAAFQGQPRFQALLQAIRAPVDLSKFNPANFPPPVAAAQLPKP